MIMAGQVYVENKKILKSGEYFNENVNIKIKDLHPEWVSRGSLKLLKAINYYNIEIKNKICLDLGASTGGFTQVLLRKKAKKIYSVDVGKNQLHEKLQNEINIINLQKTNARYLTNKHINEEIDILVCDVSFISLKKVIKPSLKFLKKNAKVISLIKPQFEGKKNELKKGIITDPEIHYRICSELVIWFKEECNMKKLGLLESPLKGTKGNTEFLIYLEFYKNRKQ